MALRMFAIPIIAAGLLVSAVVNFAGPADHERPEPGNRPRPITNPWFPLRPGTTYVYEGEKDGQRAVDVVAVTDETEVIEGVPCVVVRDLLFLGGHLAERTRDWYAQDDAGTVHYYGEATEELDEQGRVVSTEGSWRAGQAGGVAGVFMPAQPQVGQTFRQEFAAGVAEDQFTVKDLSASVSVPFGTFDHALLTNEFTRLEPDVLDQKDYVRGVGMVKEESVRGPHERLVLDTVVQAGTANGGEERDGD